MLDMNLYDFKLPQELKEGTPKFSYKLAKMFSIREKERVKLRRWQNSNITKME